MHKLFYLIPMQIVKLQNYFYYEKHVKVKNIIFHILQLRTICNFASRKYISSHFKFKWKLYNKIKSSGEQKETYFDDFFQQQKSFASDSKNKSNLLCWKLSNVLSF